MGPLPSARPHKGQALTALPPAAYARRGLCKASTGEGSREAPGVLNDLGEVGRGKETPSSLGA